jgi:hypothetical protein
MQLNTSMNDSNTNIMTNEITVNVEELGPADQARILLLLLDDLL